MLGHPVVPQERLLRRGEPIFVIALSKLLVNAKNMILHNYVCLTCEGLVLSERALRSFPAFAWGPLALVAAFRCAHEGVQFQTTLHGGHWKKQRRGEDFPPLHHRPDSLNYLVVGATLLNTAPHSTFT